MQLSAVLLARVIGFVESFDLNPRGKAYYPKIVELLVKRFGFQKYPTTVADYDEQKGVDFIGGFDGEKTIEKITVWHNGIGVDLRTSTEDAKALLHSTLTWLSKEIGLVYAPGMMKRWAYLSQITYFSPADFDLLNEVLQKMGLAISKELTQLHNMPFEFKTTGLTLGFDRYLKQIPVANLIIQRRADAPFGENKYYSEAPLPTESHIRLLQEFETDLIGK